MMSQRPPRRAALRIALQNLEVEVSDESEEEPAFIDTYSSSEEEGPAPPMRPSNDHQNEWHFVNVGHDIPPVPVPEFSGFNGMDPQLDVPDNAEDVGFFIDTFITDDLLCKVVEWTNGKAERQFKTCLAENLELPRILENWRPTTTLELKKYLGLTFLMAINKKPELEMYWSQDELYFSSFFSRSEALSRDRFLALTHFLRFADYDQIEDENDSYKKIEPFLNEVQRICKNSRLPKKDISVDEKLMLYKGRLYFRQYIPNKRSRYGIKIYACCESQTGYLWNFLLHTSAKHHHCFGNDVPNAENFSHSERVIIELVKDILDQGYHIFADNWFSSVKLASFLIERNTLYTGTLRECRGVPAMLRLYKTAVRESHFSRSGKVLIAKFADKKSSGKKTVYLIDTSSAAKRDDVTEVRKGGEVIRMQKPSVIGIYNSNMGGVDRTDAEIHPYSANRNKLNWFLKTAMYFFQLLLRNAFVFYSESGGRKNFLQFHEAAVRHFVLTSGTGRRPGAIIPREIARSAEHCTPRELNLSHLPTRIPATSNNAKPCKRCRVCYSQGRRKETRFECTTCKGKPGLCVEPCFRLFCHSQHN